MLLRRGRWRGVMSVWTGVRVVLERGDWVCETLRRGLVCWLWWGVGRLCEVRPYEDCMCGSGWKWLKVVESGRDLKGVVGVLLLDSFLIHVPWLAHLVPDQPHTVYSAAGGYLVCQFPFRLLLPSIGPRCERWMVSKHVVDVLCRSSSSLIDVNRRLINGFS